MRCELNAFGWLRQDLVYIQIIDRPLRTLNRFSRCALLKRPFGLEYKLYKSFAVYLEHSAQETETWNTESLPVPATVADHRRTHDNPPVF